jgi:hypothetical protein
MENVIPFSGLFAKTLKIKLELKFTRLGRYSIKMGY